MKRFPVGLVIGRFQPFHYGHKYLFKRANSVCKNILIGIGSSNKRNKENPFTYPQRKSMLEVFLEKEKMKVSVIKIFPLPDTTDDAVWLQSVLEKAGKFDVVIGDNEWVNNIFEKAGYKVIRIGYFKRDLYEGKKIRNLLAKHTSWEQLSPSYIVDMITKRK